MYNFISKAIDIITHLTNQNIDKVCVVKFYYIIMRNFPKLDYKSKRICDIPSILYFAQGMDINDK